MYPVDKVPSWIKVLIFINPVNYSVDLLRSVMLNIKSNYGIFLDLLFILCFSAIFLSIAIYLFIMEGK